MNDVAKAGAKELVIGFIDEMNVSPFNIENISDDLELQGELNIDSLNKLILLTRITEHLGIEFANANRTIADFKTVGDLVSFVEESAK
jgi:acyl carrier protein